MNKNEFKKKKIKRNKILTLNPKQFKLNPCVIMLTCSRTFLSRLRKSETRSGFLHYYYYIYFYFLDLSIYFFSSLLLAKLKRREGFRSERD